MKELISMVYYDESSPTFLRWIKDHSTRVRKDKVAGTLSKDQKYGRVSYKQKKYPIQNVVWTLFYGEIPEGYIIDHKDMDRSNNNLTNLRLCTHSQNMMNTRVRSTNKEGIKGLFWSEQMQRWCGTITVQGNRKRFKSKDKQAVIDWLVETREDCHKDFCNHG